MLRKKRDIWLAATLFTVFTVTVSILWNLAWHPPEDWFYEIVSSTVVAAGLTFPLTWLMAAQVVRNYELGRELQRIVDRDRLTDVATRDYFFSRMEADPEAFGVSLVIDIDHFKRVNDTHGHLAGDKVIRTVAEVLRRICRQQDIICRFGGEEFVVFLYEAWPEHGQEIAERIRRMIEEMVIYDADRQLSVTVSIGGAMKPAAQHIEETIRLADGALYEAKEGGRNRIVMSWALAA